MFRKALALLFVLLIATGIFLWLNRPETIAAKIQRVTDSENVIEQLSGPLDELANFLATQDDALSASINETIEYLGPQNLESKQWSNKGLIQIGTAEMEPGPARNISPQEIWAGLRTNNASGTKIHQPSLGILSNHRIGPGEYELKTKFEGTLQSKPPIGIRAKQTLKWKQLDGKEWKLTSWVQTQLKLVRLESKEVDSLFEDVTDTAFAEPSLAKALKRSSHQELISKNAHLGTYQLTDVSDKYSEFNDWESAYQYPAVSVVDFDQDGWDDLFVTDRWQSPHLLRNEGDGTFSDATEKSGLNIDQFACCTLFADFDNDGDPDVFVCRSLETSQYFENEGGRFKHVPSVTDEFMKFAVSASVVDINNDGLLDLYINTYGYPLEERDWPLAFRSKDIPRMRQRTEDSHWFLDRAGAPNIVLLNRNGKLQRVEVDSKLGQWRNSYQSQWFDFDEDGDLDVYICNDFAPDELLINETKRGSFDLQFETAPKDTFPEGTMSFGMGASLGDYNNDGLLDLYVSNMYSKAGNRIIGQLPDVNPRIAASAKGSFLYENQRGKFSQVAGTKTGQHPVSNVGWSFGGQFADFNNDGQLDLYVPSGYYTPPSEIKYSGDL